MTVPDVAKHGAAPGDKGLKSGALGFMSSVVIGVASTAPGYSLAASLGAVAAAVALHAPAALLIAFVSIAGALLGSVVLRLVQRSPLPVLVVPAEGA